MTPPPLHRHLRSHPARSCPSATVANAATSSAAAAPALVGATITTLVTTPTATAPALPAAAVSRHAASGDDLPDSRPTRRFPADQTAAPPTGRKRRRTGTGRQHSRKKGKAEWMEGGPDVGGPNE